MDFLFMIYWLKSLEICFYSESSAGHKGQVIKTIL